MPNYISTRLNFDLEASGIIAVLPYICVYVVYLSSGALADFLIGSYLSQKNWCIDWFHFAARKIFSITVVRKILQSHALLGSGLFLVLVGFVDSPTIAIVFLTLAVAFIGCKSNWFECKKEKIWLWTSFFKRYWGRVHCKSSRFRMSICWLAVGII